MAIPIPLPAKPGNREPATKRPDWTLAHAANEAYPAPPPAIVAESDTPEGPRLAGAFLASLMLHLGLAIVVSSTLTFTTVKETPSPPLTVTLAQAREAPAEPIDTPLPTIVPQPPADTVLPASPPELPKKQARFIVDPDLSLLEEIPTTLPGSITLRLYITEQGLVERVSVVRADPVPTELLDGLVDRFGKARLAPAMVGSQPQASSLDVTIRVDPPAQFFDPVR